MASAQGQEPWFVAQERFWFPGSKSIALDQRFEMQSTHEQLRFPEALHPQVGMRLALLPLGLCARTFLKV